MKPNMVKIGAVHYTVEYVERLLGEDGVTKLNGWIRFNESKMLIDADLSEQRQGITVLHEALHGIFENAGADDVDDQENWIDIAAHGLLGVIRENLDLMEWLMKL